MSAVRATYVLIYSVLLVLCLVVAVSKGAWGWGLAGALGFGLLIWLSVRPRRR